MQNVDVLLGGWLDGAVLRNQVTNSLMTITVIKVGIVNCFLLGLMSLGGQGGCGCRNAIRETEGGGEEVREFCERWGVIGEAGVGRRKRALEYGIELSVRVMIRRHRCGHVRNEFHGCWFCDFSWNVGVCCWEGESFSDRGLTLFMLWHNKTEAWKMREETDVHSN